MTGAPDHIGGRLKESSRLSGGNAASVRPIQCSVPTDITHLTPHPREGLT